MLLELGQYIRKIIIEWFKNFFSKFRINANTRQTIERGRRKAEYITRNIISKI
jgi:hypothetical protein